MTKSIINVRRSSIWRGRRELITDVRKPRNHVHSVIVSWRRAICWLLKSPSQTCHWRSSNQRAPDAGFFPVGGMPTAKTLGLKRLLSEKSGRCGIAAVKERGALPYDWSWWYPSDNRPLRSNIWASLPGAGYGQFEHKADSLIAKIQRSGRNSQEIDVWAESPRLSLWLSASSICLSWAVNHYW